MIRLALVVAATGLVIGALMPTGQSRPPAASASPSSRTLMVEPQPSQAAAAAVSGPWTTLTRQANGHFYARALVNGQSVDFIVDTGATAVALTEADARRIGIPLDPANYAIIGSGASGAVRGQPVILDSVSLDGKRVEQVQGAVLEGSEISLLGQAFLARMGNIEIAGERMIIR